MNGDGVPTKYTLKCKFEGEFVLKEVGCLNKQKSIKDQKEQTVIFREN
jgi:hypothetical protein